MRIVIVEDEILIREGIVRLVNRVAATHQVVGEAANGREGLAAILTCMLRYFNPRAKNWDGPNADFTPYSDDLPWCMETRTTVEIKYGI